MAVVTNSFEGGTNGTLLTTANTGGTSGNAFDVVNNTGSGAVDNFDNTHTAHGTMAIKVATGVTGVQACTRWTTSVGTVSQAWFRAYLYFTAIPTAITRFMGYANSSGSNTCGIVAVNTSGKIQFFNASGSSIITTTNVIPLNAWFRVEGMLIGSATVGQLQLKTFTTSMDGVVPDELLTSTATQNTFGSPGMFSFGQVASTASVGPFWMDDVGISTLGYLGPYGSPTSPNAGAFMTFIA